MFSSSNGGFGAINGQAFGNLKPGEPAQLQNSFGKSQGQNVSLSSSAPYVNSTSGGNNQPTTLFGTANTSTSQGFTGSSGQGNIFGTSMPSSNTPYGQNEALLNIDKVEQTMPPSLTGSLFTTGAHFTSKKVYRPSTSGKGISKPSFASRVARRIGLFRVSDGRATTSTMAKLKGLFSQNDRIYGGSGSAETENSKGEKMPSLRASISDPGKMCDFRKLIIRSVPAKFQMINANQILDDKRKCLLSQSSELQYEMGRNDPDMELKIDEHSKGVSFKTAQEGKIEKFESSEGHEVIDTINLEAMSNEYFCTPSLEELSLLSLHQLSSVKHFIIGRVGHGQISYSYPVDISKIFGKLEYDLCAIKKELFGRIIVIDKSIVRVYDCENYAPPKLGHELNVPATITVRAPPKGCTLNAHIQKLQKLTGMEFVTYDPVHFNWTFRVKHFSVWGLIDDSENEEDESDELRRLRDLKKVQDSKENDASITYSKLYQNDSYRSELKRQKLESQMSGIPGGWDFEVNTAVNALGVKQSSVQNEINQEVNAFKESKLAHALASNASDITSESEAESVGGYPDDYLLESLPPRREGNKYDYLKQIVTEASPFSDFDQLVDEKPYEPEITSKTFFDGFERPTTLPTSRNWLLQLELSNDLNSAFAKVPASTRELKQALFDIKSLNGMLLPEIDMERVKIEPLMAQEGILKDQTSFDKIPDTNVRSTMSEPYEGLLSQSNYSKRDNGYPENCFDGKVAFSFIAEAFKNDRHLEILNLASILFEKSALESNFSNTAQADTSLRNRLEVIERNRAFVAWLKSYNKEYLVSKSSELGELFCAICAGDVKSAVDLAVQTKKSHLATLLTLLDSNDSSVKLIAQCQLDSWEESSEIGFIPTDTLWIFRILAGKFKDLHSAFPNRVLIGLYVCYGSPDTSIEANFSALPAAPESCELSSLLRISCAWNTGVAGDVAKEIEKSDLNYSVKWLLTQVMSQRLQDVELSTLKNSFGILLGSELEERGLWRDALFVYSMMSDDVLVEQAFRKVVINNITQVVGDKERQESCLVGSLNVPRRLLYEAYAIDSRRKRNIWRCGDELVVAEMWQELHDTILNELGPSAVIEEDPMQITQLRAIISKFPQNGSVIPNWNQGAGFYAKYFDILEANEKHDAFEISDIIFLLDNASRAKAGVSFRQSVSIKIICKNIGDLAIEQHFWHPELSANIFSLCSGENEQNYFKARLNELHESAT